MKVFISQLMNGRDPEMIIQERKQIMEYVRKLYPDAEEIQSFFGHPDMDSKNTPLKMLGMSLELMAEADLVVFADCWSLGRGCKIEHDAALQYGLKILDLEL